MRRFEQERALAAARRAQDLENRICVPNTNRNKHDILRRVATRLGVPLWLYEAELRAGNKWCSKHRAFHRRTLFGKNRGEADGLNPSCREAQNAYSRRRHKSKTRKLQPDEWELLMDSHRCDMCSHLEALHSSNGYCRLVECPCTEGK